MRVLFSVLAVCSIGLLLWTPLFRLAIVRRRTSDWWLAGAGLVLVCVIVPILGRDGSDEPSGIDNVLIPLLLLAVVGSVAYYLVADIRHYERLARPQAVGPYPQGAGVQPDTVIMHSQGRGEERRHGRRTERHTADGHAPTAPVFTPAPTSPAGPVPASPVGPAPASPVGPAAQQPRSPQESGSTEQPRNPQRIEQVRAELDELSAYLRKEGGR